MGTVHKDACEFHAKTWMNNEAGRSVLTEYLWKMQTGFFDREYQNIIVQKYWGKFDFADAYAFAQIHAMMTLGEIASFKVDVGKEPYRDSHVDENNSVLKRLGPIFGAIFAPQKGGSADDDGLFWWDAPVKASVIVDPPNVTEWVILAPKRIPLEVGYTEASKTVMHVKGEGAVARWPYGDTCITVLVWQGNEQ